MSRRRPVRFEPIIGFGDQSMYFSMRISPKKPSPMDDMFVAVAISSYRAADVVERVFESPMPHLKIIMFESISGRVASR